MNTAILSRPVMDCEQLVVHKFTNGVVALAAGRGRERRSGVADLPSACWRKLTSLVSRRSERFDTNSRSSCTAGNVPDT